MTIHVVHELYSTLRSGQAMSVTSQKRIHELQLNLHVWILKGSLFLQNLEKKVFIIKHTCNPGARSPKAQTSLLYTYG